MKPESANSTDLVTSRHGLHRHEVNETWASCDNDHGHVEIEEAQDNTIGDVQRTSDKKTDEALEPQSPPSGGYLWRFSSSVLGTTSNAITGAVGLGFGGIKWAASKGYTAGSVVLDTTKSVAGRVPVPTWKAKDKKE